MDPEAIKKIKQNYSKYVSREPQRIYFRSLIKHSQEESLKKNHSLILTDKDTFKPKNRDLYHSAKKMQEVKFNFDVKARIFDQSAFNASSMHKSTLNTQDSTQQLPNISAFKQSPGADNLQSNISTQISSIRMKTGFQNPRTKTLEMRKRSTQDLQSASVEVDHFQKLKDQKEKEMQDDTLYVLEKLRQRNCKENIKQYKEELEKYKYLQNPFNVTMSFSNIEQKITKLVGEHHHSESNTHMKFRKLREYLRLYKQRLYLVPRHQILEEDKDSHGMDFVSYKHMLTRNVALEQIVQEHHHESQELMRRIGYEGSSVGLKSNHKISDKAIDQAYNKFRETQAKEMNSNEIRRQVTESGGCFINMRTNPEVERAENNQILKVAEEIEKKYFRVGNHRRTKLTQQQAISRLNKRSMLNDKTMAYDSSRCDKFSPKSPLNQDFPSRSIDTFGVMSDTSQEHLTSLSNIYQSCTKIKMNKQQLVQRYRKSHKMFNKELNSCQNLLEEVEVQNHLGRY